MGFKVFSEVNNIKGFLDPLEGEALYEYASKFVSNKPALEIGSYCGKSSVYIGTAIKKNNQKLYSVDHHKGSEEQQPCLLYTSPSPRDSDSSRMPSSA